MSTDAGGSAPRNEPQYLGESWVWAVLLTAAEFAPPIAVGIAIVGWRAGGATAAVGGVLLMLASIGLSMRWGELDDGGTRAVREGYRSWRRARTVGVAVTFAVAFSPLGGWLAQPWRSGSLVDGLLLGAALAAVAGIGWLFHPGDQVLSAYGTAAGLPVDVLLGPVWLVRALTGHGLLLALLAVASSSVALGVAAFLMVLVEYLLARRTSVIVSRTTFWGLVSGRQPPF
jgi:hypothetical protein